MRLKLHPASALCSAVALVLGACATPHSGQTGSPVYESPDQEPPESGGGEGPDEPDVGNPQPILLPEPPEAPGEVEAVDGHLLVAGKSGLVIYDAAEPRAPREQGRFIVDGFASILAADGLDHIVLSLSEQIHYRASSIPDQRMPEAVWRVVVVDASDPSAPRRTASFDVPDGTLAVTVDADGYALIGADTVPAVRICGGGDLGDIARPPPAVQTLWLQRYAAGAGELRAGARVELGAGHFRSSSDGAHVIRLSQNAGEQTQQSLQVDVIELRTLATVLTVSVPPSALDQRSGIPLTADYADGVLALASGARLLTFMDGMAAGAPLVASSTIGRVQFLPGGELIRLEGPSQGLTRVERSSGSPLASFVAGADRAAGWLTPFGSGFLALTGVGSDYSLALNVSVYDLVDGNLVQRDTLQTQLPFSSDWYAHGAFRVDESSQRALYVFPAADGERTEMVAISDSGGQIVLSEVVTTERVTRPPWLGGDVAYAVGDGTLQVLSLDAAAPGLSLTAAPASTVVPQNVRTELQHGGKWWAVHRTDTGRTSLSVRDSEFGQPEFIDLPHGAENIVPLDETHVAVFGLSLDGLCSGLVDLGDFPECGPGGGNGVSVVAVDADGARVVKSLELGSAIGAPPPPGIQQALDWSGYFETEPGHWALLANLREQCSSVESCAQLGVPAYRGFGTASCGSGQQCDSSVQEFVSGSRVESWVFDLDLTDPGGVVLGPAARGGGHSALHEVYENNLANVLLRADGDETIWAYGVQEHLYDAAGNSLRDAHDQALSRWYLQLMTGAGAALAFEPPVNVPGQPIGLSMSDAGLRAYTLEPSYDGDGQQFVRLHQLRIDAGAAFIEHSLDVGRYVGGAQARGDRLVLMNYPESACTATPAYSLRSVDVSGDEPQLSESLVLLGTPEYGWSLSSYDRVSDEAGVFFVSGGPAARGRLVVDLNTSPPGVASYETRSD